MIFASCYKKQIRKKMSILKLGSYKNNKRPNQSEAKQTKSEAYAIKCLEEITGKKFLTVRPKWLNNYELDGYNKELGIALEFSGPLHTHWYPAKESYEIYYGRVIRDQYKKEICKKKNICLIEIDMSLPKKLYKDYLKSRLYDCGKWVIKPSPYIEPQQIIPFRNSQLEVELNLNNTKSKKTK